MTCSIKGACLPNESTGDRGSLNRVEIHVKEKASKMEDICVKTEDFESKTMFAPSVVATNAAL